MKDIDERIRQALLESERDDFDSMAELSAPMALIETIRGKNSWLMFVAIGFTLIMIVAFFYSVVQFSEAETTHQQLGWSVGLIFCLMAISMLKIWCWMELNRISVMREIKRVELQFVHLANRLDRTSVSEKTA